MAVLLFSNKDYLIFHFFKVLVLLFHLLQKQKQKTKKTYPLWDIVKGRPSCQARRLKHKDRANQVL